MASTPQLPYDVVERILHTLQGDINSLQNCSLSSRSLRILAQQVLFSYLVIFNGSRCRRVLETLLDKSSMIKYVRHMHIVFDTWISRECHDLASIAQLVRPFINVISINRHTGIPISFNLLHESNKAIIFDLISSPSVTEVNLAALNDFPFSYLASCVGLKHLSLYNVDLPQIENFETARTIPFSSNTDAGHLDVLCLNQSGRAASAFVRAVTDPTSLLKITSLRKLVIRGVDSAWGRDPSELLDVVRTISIAAANSLEDVEWWLPRVTAGQKSPIPLECMTRLKTLQFVSPGISNYMGLCLSWLATVLQKIDRPHPLVNIHLTLECYSIPASVKNNAGESMLWKCLDSSLAQVEMFSNFRLLSVSFSKLTRMHPWNPSTVRIKQAMETKMPRLHAAGILRIEGAGVV